MTKIVTIAVIISSNTSADTKKKEEDGVGEEAEEKKIKKTSLPLKKIEKYLTTCKVLDVPRLI